MNAAYVPDQLAHAREEVLKSLSSPTASGAREHRLLAERFVTRAVRELARAPDQEIDWSLLVTEHGQ